MDFAKKYRVPGHLKPPTKAWFADCLANYQLEPHHVRLLQLAGEAWDRTQQARARLDAEGLTVTGRAHPCIAIERDSRTAFARLIRELDLDVEEPLPERIARARGNRGG